ncbi:MAG: guanylate kinase, guanylate kinase [Candidatus Peregrinibacteria bacterium GW2011_GWE2_39_6]|nr:MAG: guanylate kinase, guanylate kinase [Candidatus Peregrinibacteria bacterium GW2011_GWF2_39_17]KKR25775.1 MAG: guanylate kinase, guanylate kinase [Candidatus Peregrinibacteria bacterium GW2011_GWE2_39_6]HCW32730.1 guanylate kinase [Candidatus Peregrinibacteria bacterium]
MTGKLFLILGSSGSGKGTVLNNLRRKYSKFVFPLSCTTRLRRPMEQDGEIYHFIAREEFELRIKKGDFLEYAVVHQNNYYGTLKKPIIEALDAGKTVIREVDVQGLRSIRKLIPSTQLVSIFLMVPDWDTLQARILHRSKMAVDELQRRYASFLMEMTWGKECDYQVESLDGQVAKLAADVEKIILQEIEKA